METQLFECIEAYEPVMVSGKCIHVPKVKYFPTTSASASEIVGDTYSPWLWTVELEIKPAPTLQANLQPSRYQFKKEADAIKLRMAKMLSTSSFPADSNPMLKFEHIKRVYSKFVDNIPTKNKKIFFMLIANTVSDHNDRTKRVLQDSFVLQKDDLRRFCVFRSLKDKESFSLKSPDHDSRSHAKGFATTPNREKQPTGDILLAPSEHKCSDELAQQVGYQHGITQVECGDSVGVPRELSPEEPNSKSLFKYSSPSSDTTEQKEHGCIPTPPTSMDIAPFHRFIIEQ